MYIERILRDMRTFFLYEYSKEFYVTGCSCCFTPVLTVLAAPLTSFVLLANYKDNVNTPYTTPLFIIRKLK